MKIILGILLLLLISCHSYSQESVKKGVPPMQIFSPNDYQNKGKVWDIEASPAGLIYMAADKGLLEFDGKSWRSFKGSVGFTRSILVANDTIIYTGSDLDFGVWKKNKYFDFEYNSLYPFKGDTVYESEEFWNVHQINEDILFLSSQNIYLLKKDQLTKIQALHKFSGSFKVGEKTFIVDEKIGLFQLIGQKLELVFNYPTSGTFEIAGIFEQSGFLMIVTKDDGLFYYDSGQLKPIWKSLSERLKTGKVFTFCHLNNGDLAFGTVLSGLIIADTSGNIIHDISKNKGLLNNTILSLFQSNRGTLWMGMDFGVTALDLNSAYSYFYDYSGGFGTAYSALLQSNDFYLGTNQGLYTCNWENLANNTPAFNFDLVKGTEGQVWTLANIDGQLLIGHDKGLFFYDGKRISNLYSSTGVWDLTRYGTYLLAGTYNGILIFKKNGDQWSFDHKMNLILGSCNQLVVQGDHTLWVNIPNFGIIRTTLDNQLRPIERIIFNAEIFQGENIQILLGQDYLKVITDQALYLYEENTKEFRIANDYDFNSLPKVEVVIHHPVMSSPLDSVYEFYPVHNGFALKAINDAFLPNNDYYKLVFRHAEVFNNDLRVSIFSGASLPNDLNNIRLEYIVPNAQKVKYQFRSNSMKDWSPWSESNTFELLNLGFGKHQIEIRAELNGFEFEPQSFTFHIQYPWYLSWYAFLIYLVLGGGLMLLAYRAHNTNLKMQKLQLLRKEQNSLREQAKKHREKMMQLEQDKLHQLNESLQEQLKSKTVELATKAKENEDKNRLLESIKEKSILAKEKPETSKRVWNEINDILDTYLKTEDNTFEIQMDELYQDFFRKLKEAYPSLSSYDLRLCAYLRIGLNSKEIADILNIQPSSSYISRSRLRKKLNLEATEDLYNFLNKI